MNLQFPVAMWKMLQRISIFQPQISCISRFEMSHFIIIGKYIYLTTTVDYLNYYKRVQKLFAYGTEIIVAVGGKRALEIRFIGIRTILKKACENLKSIYSKVEEYQEWFPTFLTCGVFFKTKFYGGPSYLFVYILHVRGARVGYY